MVKSCPADPGAHLASGDPCGAFSNNNGLRKRGRSTKTSRLGVGETSLSVIVFVLLYLSLNCSDVITCFRLLRESFFFIHFERLCFSFIYCRKVHSLGNHYSSMMPHHQPLITNPMAMSAHQPISIGIAHVVWPQPAANKRNKPSSNRLVHTSYPETWLMYGGLELPLKNKFEVTNY